MWIWLFLDQHDGSPGMAHGWRCKAAPGSFLLEKSKLPGPWMLAQVLFWMSLAPSKKQQPLIMAFWEALGTAGFALRHSRLQGWFSCIFFPQCLWSSFFNLMDVQNNQFSQQLPGQHRGPVQSYLQCLNLCSKGIFSPSSHPTPLRITNQCRTDGGWEAKLDLKTFPHKMHWQCQQR